MADFPECKAVTEASTSVLWSSYGKKVEHQGIKGGCSLENIQLPLADDPVVTLGSVTDFPECKAVAEV